MCKEKKSKSRENYYNWHTADCVPLQSFLRLSLAMHFARLTLSTESTFVQRVQISESYIWLKSKLPKYYVSICFPGGYFCPCFSFFYSAFSAIERSTTKFTSIYFLSFRKRRQIKDKQWQIKEQAWKISAQKPKILN